MDKYKLLAFLDATTTIFVIAVILISAIFKNYWLLFLILLGGVVEETQKRILNSKWQKTYLNI